MINSLFYFQIKVALFDKGHRPGRCKNNYSYPKSTGLAGVDFAFHYISISLDPICAGLAGATLGRGSQTHRNRRL
jgi:hypothetical protein